MCFEIREQNHIHDPVKQWVNSLSLHRLDMFGLEVINQLRQGKRFSFFHYVRSISKFEMAGFADQSVHVPHRPHVLIVGKTIDEHGKWRNLAKHCMKPFDEMMDRDEDPNAAWQVSDNPKTVPGFAR